MDFSRQEYWSGFPSPPPGDLPNPGTELRSPALQANYLPSKPPGKPSEKARIEFKSYVLFLVDRTVNKNGTIVRPLEILLKVSQYLKQHLGDNTIYENDKSNEKTKKNGNKINSNIITYFIIFCIFFPHAMIIAVMVLTYLPIAKTKRVTRGMGIAMVLVYVAYTVYLIMR